MKGSTVDIWWLWPTANTDNNLTPDIEYFKSHFVGSPMAETWEPPTDLRWIYKSRKVRDFVSWFHGAPVISERARQVLRPLLDGHTEILPLITVKGRQYYAVNVLTVVDCLDRDKSVIWYTKDGSGRILDIRQHVFDPERTQPVPIFKIPESTSAVFVTRPFVDAVIKAQLAGAQFVDPTTDPLHKILKKLPLNDVPGVKT